MRQISKAAVAGVLALRWGTVAQVVSAALGGSVSRADRPVVSAVGMSAYAAASAAISGALVLAGRPDVRAVAAGDVALMSALLMVQRSYAAPETGMSTWDAWGYGASIPTAVLVGLSADTNYEVLAGMAALIGSYAVGISPSAKESGGWGTVVANSAGILVGSLASHLVWRHGLEIAAEADRAKTLDLKLTEARKVIDQQRRAFDASFKEFERRVKEDLHRYAGELASEGIVLVNDGREEQGEVLIALAQKLQSKLGVRGNMRTLGGALQAGAANTRVHVSMVLADDTRDLELPSEVLERMSAAVRSFIKNTEQHSGVMSATVLAELKDSVWTVTLIDNGRGYDPNSTVPNTGLRHELGNALRHVGLDVRVESAPGTGVSVEISGLVEAAAGPERGE